MFIDETELARRLNRVDNLIHKIRRTPTHKGRAEEIEDGKGRREGDKNVPPIIREIVGTLAHYDSRKAIADSFNVSPAQVTNYKHGFVSPQRGVEDAANQKLAEAIDKNLGKVRDRALDKLVMTLDAISPEKIALTTKVKDLAVIASNLSKVVQQSMPLAIQKDTIQQVGVSIYSPPLKTEKDYETITINKES